MNMFVANSSEYAGKYSQAENQLGVAGKLKKIGDLLIAFTPFFWVSLFILLTVLVKVIGG